MFTPSQRFILALRYNKNLPADLRGYLHDRGIPDSVIDEKLLGWNGHRIVIPVFDSQSAICQFRYARSPRDLSESPKMLTEFGTGPELYGWERLATSPRRIVICEGEFDRPSASTTLRPRDCEALAFVGRSYELAQYQLHAAIFHGRAPNVVSRLVQRAKRLGFISAERLHGIGMNRLRLTNSGREFLVARGVARREELFVPQRAVALKDLAHTLAINDLAVALRQLRTPPTPILPAWFLARALGGASEVVPDVLAIWRRPNAAELRLACEIDLGAEGLRTVFLPKLERLTVSLASPQTDAGILILTRGERRLQHLAGFARTAPIPVLPFLLPETAGRARIDLLRHLVSVE
ncbi:MAG: replication-relaxation family protein [Acidobacteria bacterium]|nr:replication-relaxation family protein [Acidobacteriota bacterium]